MKTGHYISRTILSIAVAAVLGAPLAVSAVTTQESARSAKILYDRESLESVKEAEALYLQLRNEARRICGSSKIRLTGSLDRAVANEECYEGSLQAAVERVDNPAVTDLHRQ